MTHRLTVLLAAALALPSVLHAQQHEEHAGAHAEREARHRELREQLRAGPEARRSIAPSRCCTRSSSAPPSTASRRCSPRTRRCAIAYWGIALGVLGQSIRRRALHGRAAGRARGCRERRARRARRRRASVRTSPPSPRCSKTTRRRRSAIASSRTSAAWRRSCAQNPQRHRGADLSRAGRESNGVADGSRPMRRSCARSGFSSRCTRSIRITRASRTTSFTRTTIRRSPRERWAPRAATPTIAPSAPHALHMPSHTFTRVGAWQESVDTNRLSEQSAMRQRRRHRSAARDGLSDLRAICKWRRTAPPATCSIDCRRSRRRSIPRESRAARRRRWRASTRSRRSRRATRSSAARGKKRRSFAVPSAGTPFTIAIAHFARALGAARSGRASAAGEDVARARRAARPAEGARRVLGRAGRHPMARRPAHGSHSRKDGAMKASPRCRPRPTSRTPPTSRP